MKKAVFIVSMVCTAVINSVAQKSAVFITSGSVAVKGYDVVAYFTEHKPVTGSDSFSIEWNNVNWHFSNQQNFDRFKANPEKFAPQYGGYCAYGTSEGHKAPTDPNAWTIVNDKLYLNYNKDVKKMWLEDQKNLIEKADRNWPGIKDSE